MVVSRVFGFVVVASLLSVPAGAAVHKAAMHKASEKVAKHKKNLTGKTGGLENFKVRAVMNVDGSTDLSVAWVLEPGYVPSNDPPYFPVVRKAQLKTYDETGHHVRTENIQIGQLSQVFHRTDLRRHWRIDAEATVDNVTTYDYTRTPPVLTSPRTYVLSDSTTVQRRPDLALVSVEAPQTVTAGTSSVIYMTVREMGGDLPAEGICHGEGFIQNTDQAFAYFSPVAISVDPGQTVVCAIYGNWFKPGSWTWKARVRLPGNPEWYFATERNLANNDVAMPLTITGGGPTAARNGFVSSSTSFERSATHVNYVESRSGVEIMPDRYYEYDLDLANISDFDSGSIGVLGVAAGWMPYPLTLRQLEFTSAGAAVVDATAVSQAPSISGTDAYTTLDQTTYEWYQVSEDHSSDWLVDDATGTTFSVDRRRIARQDTGEVKTLQTTVQTHRNFGQSMFFGTTSGLQRFAPDQPFDFVNISDSSFFLDYTLGTPPNLANTYRVAMSVVDGAGETHSSDASFPLDVQNYPDHFEGCYDYTYDGPEGYFVSSSCYAGTFVQSSTSGFLQ